MKAYEKAGVKIGNKVKLINNNKEVIGIILSPKDELVKGKGLSCDGDVFVYVKIENSKINRGLIGGFYSEKWTFEILENTDTNDTIQMNKCNCGGPSKLLELFSSSVIICSVCGKDK